MYPKARLDALSDAIFGVSMTLLVLDVRLPEAFHPHDGRELVRGLAELLSKFLPYVLSFVVLGLRWLSNIHVRSREATCSRKYAEWRLIYHLLITFVPFTTMVAVGLEYFAPPIWHFSGNTIF